MAVVQFFTPIDLISDEEWNWDVTQLSTPRSASRGLSIPLRSPVPS